MENEKRQKILADKRLTLLDAIHWELLSLNGHDSLGLIISLKEDLEAMYKQIVGRDRSEIQTRA